MREVIGQCGDNREVILFPKAEDHFLDWLEGKQTGIAPAQGSVPNRFKADVSTALKIRSRKSS
ncbi:MAG: hypothetical protein R3E95_17180 [Thiolinea sp.]